MLAFFSRHLFLTLVTGYAFSISSPGLARGGHVAQDSQSRGVISLATQLCVRHHTHTRIFPVTPHLLRVLPRLHPSLTIIRCLNITLNHISLLLILALLSIPASNLSSSIPLHSQHPSSPPSLSSLLTYSPLPSFLPLSQPPLNCPLFLSCPPLQPPPRCPLSFLPSLHLNLLQTVLFSSFPASPLLPSFLPSLPFISTFSQLSFSLSPFLLRTSSLLSLLPPSLSLPPLPWAPSRLVSSPCP